MDKKELLDEIREEIKSEKREIIKDKLKDMMIEIEMGKQTVARLEAQFEKYLDCKDEDVIFEL